MKQFFDVKSKAKKRFVRRSPATNGFKSVLEEKGPNYLNCIRQSKSIETTNPDQMQQMRKLKELSTLGDECNAFAIDFKKLKFYRVYVLKYV